MNRLIGLFVMSICLGFCSLIQPVMAAEMTFQLINDTDRALNLKLFSRAESRQQWPSKSRAYSLRPDSAVQQLKISCEEGEQICWGAWMTVQSVSGEVFGPAGQRATRTSKYSAGVGERGQRTCERCCHICKEGLLTPVMGLRDPRPEAR